MTILCKGCTTLFQPQHAGHTFCTGLCYDVAMRPHVPLHGPTPDHLRVLSTAHEPAQLLEDTPPCDSAP